MLPPVRARLHVHEATTEEPERAARQICEELLETFPNRRPVSLVLVVHGPHPGLTPTPWVVGGMLAALHAAGRAPARVLIVGDRDTGEALLRKATREAPQGLDALAVHANLDRELALRVEGGRRPLSIPRELVGSSAIVCAPLCFDVQASDARRGLQGPLASSLGLLAGDRGFAPARPRRTSSLSLSPREDEDAPLRAGFELVRACFASAALVLDGTWAAALDRPAPTKLARSRGPDGRFVASRAASEPSPPTVLGELAAPDRVLGLSELGRRALAELTDVDRWLAGVLGLGPRSSAHEAPELARSPGRWPLLRPAVAPSQPSRLADRAIAGIRSQAARVRPSPKALPARVPGEFAQLWTRRWYGEHDPIARLSVGPR